LILLGVLIVAIVFGIGAVWKESDQFCPSWVAPYNIWVRAYVGGWSEGTYFSSTTHGWNHGDVSYQEWTADYWAEYGELLAGSPPVSIKSWTYAFGDVYQGPIKVDELQAYAVIYP